MDVITCRVEYRSSVFIKTVLEATFSFSDILYPKKTLNGIIDEIGAVPFSIIWF